MQASFAITAATSMLVLLMTSLFAPAIAESQGTGGKLAQQGDIITARASAVERGDAYQSAIDKAWNLCMVRGLYNIIRVNGDCAQSDAPAGHAWECVGTAACQK